MNSLGSDRAAAATRADQAQGRQAPYRRPRRPHRHPVRAKERHPLGDAPPGGDGMRLLWDDLCWRRLKEWHEAAGVWKRLRRTLLDRRLGEANEIGWERASSLDSASVAAPGGGAKRAVRTRRTKANRARSATF